MLTVAALAGCGGGSGSSDAPSPPPPPPPGTTVTAAQMNDIDLNAILAAAKDGDTITMPVGKYTLKAPLQITSKKNLTLAGQGNGSDPTKDTILSFKDALTQNGLSTSTLDTVTFKKFAIEDTAGNALFVTSSSNVVMDTVRAEWTTDPENTSTMAYGLYPVKSDNILVTNSIVVGSRDAGVYVGQSANIRVTNNDVHNNVAGVEIENSHNAVVEGNTVHQNTGGILVFALPGPTRFLDTHDVVVRNNTITDNNVPPAANAQGLVLTIPPGTGAMVLASQNVEVTGNAITNHKTTAVLITSAIGASITWDPSTLDEQGKPYDPYERGIYVHANNIVDFGTSPGGAFADPQALQPFTQGFFAELAANSQPQVFPAVLWDGIVDPVTGTGVDPTYHSGGVYAGNLQVCSKGNVLTLPQGAFINYENLDLDLYALLTQTGGAHFPNPERLDCTITLPPVTGQAG
jgi:parallel beta-helix repeat protein